MSINIKESFAQKWAQNSFNKQNTDVFFKQKRIPPEKIHQNLLVRRRKYEKNKLATCPRFLLIRRSRLAAHRVLKGLSRKLPEELFHMVGYDALLFRQHIESQFNCNMNWNNYGSYWSLDHINPVKNYSFSTVNDINYKLCWSIENLRPLEVSQNVPSRI